MLKNFIKQNLILLILFGCIIFLFLENVKLNDELVSLRYNIKKLSSDVSDIESKLGYEAAELCPPPYPMSGRGILGRLCEVESMVEALGYDVANLRRRW